jgi:hypothetical protein
VQFKEKNNQLYDKDVKAKTFNQLYSNHGVGGVECFSFMAKEYDLDFAPYLV